MKRLFCALLALAMLLTAAAAFAEKIVVLTDVATGAKVTFEMEGEYSIEYDEHCTADYVQFTVSRDGVCPVIVSVFARDAEDKNMNDMTDEELEAQRASLEADLADEGYVVTIETTSFGNKYINCVAASENGSVQQRYTVFEDFDMCRIQYSEGLFTEADTAFLAEVQASLWVEK
ncbi:MAG: hypothetical protein MJ142_01130 [Clostridia bacterium]|nr:hypothetical protein [Clostridia bacterium]